MPLWLHMEDIAVKKRFAVPVLILLITVLCLLSVEAFAGGHTSVQLWADGPYWATENFDASTPTGAGYNGQLTSNGMNPRNSTADNVPFWSGFCLPTEDEFRQLLDGTKTTLKWETKDNMPGYTITGKETGYTSKSIFLPAPGYCIIDSYSNDGNGYYFTADGAKLHISSSGYDFGGYGDNNARLVRDWPSVTATVADVSKSYNGDEYGLTPNVTDPATGYKIQYGTSKTAINQDTLKYKEPGTYTVWYRISANNYKSIVGSAKITIKRFPSIDITSDPGKTYDGKEVSTPVVSCDSNGTVTIEYKLQSEGNSAYTTTAPKEPGEYTVRASVSETETNKAAEKLLLLLITRSSF